MGNGEDRMMTKLYWYVGIALVLISGAFLGYQKIWQRGYDARVAEDIAATEQQIAEAVSAARAQWKNSAQAGAAQIKVEQKIVERIRYVDREIPKVVELAGDCRDLGPAFLRVFNGAAEAANGGEGGSPDPSREPAHRMPALPARRD